MKVIVKCDDNEASEWVNSIAFSRKSIGDLRVCLDPNFLINAMKRTHYRTPTIDDMSYKIAGPKFSPNWMLRMAIGASI